jgi:3-phenylpropionate/trans-cinnamate dioxygenase ferredoxin reductase component
MMSLQTIVIAGASLAGGRAAESLRKDGFDGRVVLVGAELDRPYERPPLSKELLWGEKAEEQLYLRPAEFYADQQIELWLGTRASRLDPTAHMLELKDGRRLAYDKLLITTGAAPRRLSVPGVELDGILYLRTIGDARELRRRMGGASRVVVVGTGFIGAEVAASCRRAGLEVVALEAGSVPLARALGQEVGELYAAIHRAHGVDLRTGETVVGFRGQGRVEQVVTASGATLDCDCAVVGVGVAPAVGWLAGAGLELQDGIVVDEFCQTTIPDVYAAGDVANWWHPTLGERLRVEHFDNAQNQGIAAARNILGKREAYAPIPYFWSDQYNLSLQYVGHASGNDRVVLRGSVDNGSWSAFYLRGEHVHAALAVNRYQDLAAARHLIAQRVPVVAEQLADEQQDLKALARRTAPAAAVRQE